MEELGVKRAQSSLRSTAQSRKRVNIAINLRSHCCAGVILICYTVLTQKGEIAVYGCNPTLSFPVVFVFRKVNFIYVVYQPCSFASILVFVRLTDLKGLKG